MAYVGISPCGCIQMAVVDDSAHAREVRKNVMEAMRWGATIERMSIEQVRSQFCITPHPKKLGCPHPGTCPSRVNNFFAAPDPAVKGET